MSKTQAPTRRRKPAAQQSGAAALGCAIEAMNRIADEMISLRRKPPSAIETAQPEPAQKAETVRALEIPSAMGDVEHWMIELREAINSIENRLVSAGMLRPEPPGEAAKEGGAPSATAMGNWLFGFADQAKNATGRILALLQRMEV